MLKYRVDNVCWVTALYLFILTLVSYHLPTLGCVLFIPLTIILFLLILFNHLYKVYRERLQRKNCSVTDIINLAREVFREGRNFGNEIFSAFGSDCLRRLLKTALLEIIFIGIPLFPFIAFRNFSLWLAINLDIVFVICQLYDKLKYS